MQPNAPYPKGTWRRDCYKAIRLLQSLPSDYDPLVHAIRISVNEVTLRRLIGAIQDEGTTHGIKNDKANGTSLERSKGIEAREVLSR